VNPTAHTPSAPLLPADVAEFIQSGVSITVASRDDRLVPSIAKAVGCRVNDDGRQVTVLMFASPAEPVARDIARHGQAAVVFSRPSTNRTVQLKGRDVRSVPPQPADVALVRRYLALFGAELAPLGWEQAFVDAVFWHDPSQLLAIRFTPEGAFLQTPGPGAGRALDLLGGARP
jgi:Pyridoxamine 5'-phosphate oxidase